MAKVEKPKGPYTVWVNYGYEGWDYTDCPTLEAALELQKYSTFVIQKPVIYVAAEDEQS